MYLQMLTSRGLRQGDPLSPALFLICTKGLSALINRAVRNQLLTGISIYRGCPRVTHLLFADDVILFYKASVKESRVLKNILQQYEDSSGQKINTDKFSIFFSPNTSQEAKDEILTNLGPMQDTRHTKYLGLPSFIGRLKKQVFATLKERIAQKLAGWKGKLLSMGGKEILIKAVAQAIPTYTMGCFLLPQNLCDDIESMMRNFWWGQRQQENKICWVSWKTMCKQKANGGMGFRNLQGFNKALLARQLWRILQNPNTLVARVFRVRYFPIGDILNANIRNSPSYSWRSIHSSLEVIRKETRWRVGNGKLIHIWDDKWLPTPSTYKIISPPNNIPLFPMVSSLIDPMTKWWNVSTIRASFLPFEAKTILKIPLSHDLPEDKIIWIGNSRGNFTVKSTYHLAFNLLDSDGNEECSTLEEALVPKSASKN